MVTRNRKTPATARFARMLAAMGTEPRLAIVRLLLTAHPEGLVVGEIAAELGMTLPEYQQLLGKVRGTQLVYLEDMTHGGDDEDGFLDRHVADAGADPAELLRDQRLRSSLVNAIKSLPERKF